MENAPTRDTRIATAARGRGPRARLCVWSRAWSIGVLAIAQTAFAEPMPPPPIPPPPAPPSYVVSSWGEALAQVRSRSTDLRAAYSDVRRAEGQWRVALAALLPNLNASGSLTHQFLTNSAYVDLSGNPTSAPVSYPLQNTLQGQVTASVPVVSVQLWQGMSVAHDDESVARLSVHETRRKIVAGVVSSLVAVAAAERVAELNRTGLQASLDRFDLVVRRRSLDVATNLDVLRAQRDVDSARSTLVLGDESLREAREALGLSLGLPQEVGISPRLDLTTLDAAVASSCKGVASAADRPDVVTARARVRASASRVTNLWFSFLPTLSAQSQLIPSSAVEPPYPATTWALEGVVTVPIWSGGSQYGAIKSAEAQREHDDADLTAAQRAAIIDIAQAERAVAVADGVLAVAQHESAVAADIEKATRSAFQDGRATSLELVVAASELREAQTTLVLREFDAIKARALQLVSRSDCSI